MTQIKKINGIPLVNTVVSAFTYNNVNKFTISNTDGTSFNASIDILSATTISGGTFYGDGSNLTGISGGSGTNTYVTGGTYSNGISTYTNSTGGTFTVSGFFSAFTIDATIGTAQDVVKDQTITYSAGSGLTATIQGTRNIFYDLDFTGTTAEVTPTTGDKLLIWDASNSEHRNVDWSDLPGSGGGENNTASNVGGANGIFYQKSGVNLEFRSLSAGTNITITSGTTNLTINSTASGGSSRVTGSTQTTNATPSEVDKIDTLTDDATNIVEVYIKAWESGAAEYGVWKRTLTVTSVSGTPTIREENADVDKTSSGLNANSINFTVNGSNIDIDVTGIAATTIDWESVYEIIL